MARFPLSSLRVRLLLLVILAIVPALGVNRHGGRIWVETEPGGGATCSFTVPDKADT
jgi:signal transduction histidine kinase